MGKEPTILKAPVPPPATCFTEIKGRAKTDMVVFLNRDHGLTYWNIWRMVSDQNSTRWEQPPHAPGNG